MAEKMRVETATVYRSGKRRYFTLRAAFRAEAREALRPWFKQYLAENEYLPGEVQSRYDRALSYLETRARRRWYSARALDEATHDR